MRLIGKRVERLNRYGDDLCIELKDKGSMRISPALKSRMDIPNSGNKVGFAYPETDDTMQQVMMYVAPDGNGVAVNNQGVLNNTPHNRDLRSHYEESGTGDVKLFVAEQYMEIDDFEGYKFFKIKSKNQIHSSETEEFFSEPDEDETDELTVEDTYTEPVKSTTTNDSLDEIDKALNQVEEVEHAVSDAEVVEDPDDMW